jgi:serine protease Do
MRILPLHLLAFVLICCGAAVAQEDLPLREQVKDITPAPHWIYDDLPRAEAEARETGKPLLVVLRCVPCPPGKTLDGQVMNPDPELEALEKKFVCVRVIQTKGLDLKRFSYDYDMSWAAMFLTADGTILGRYGTRNASGHQSDNLISVSGFRRAAERALALHANYPANKAQLADKLAKSVDYPRPEEIPGLTDRKGVATTRRNCIHCHMVREYALRAKWEAGQLTKKDLFVFPMPQRVGLTLDVDDGLVVQKVAPGSAAAQAGFAPGDELVSISGQPLISTADVQWALHIAPVEATLPVTLRRNGKLLEKELKLSGDWKESDISWRASSWYGLRQGVKFEELPAAERAKLGLTDNQLALVIKGLYGRGGPKLQQAGFKVGDVIVAIDGKDTRLTESQFLTFHRLNYGPQDRIKFTIQRGGKRQDISIQSW